MADHTVTLSNDELIVLPEFLDPMLCDDTIPYPSPEWWALSSLIAAFEDANADAFAPDYLDRLARARERLGSAAAGRG